MAGLSFTLTSVKLQGIEISYSRTCLATITVRIRMIWKPRLLFKTKIFSTTLSCYRGKTPNAPATQSYENIGMEGKVRGGNREEPSKGIKVQVEASVSL